MSPLLNRVAFITGASSGIGAAVATALVPAGTRLFLCGRDEARLQATADRCRSQAAEVETHAADLTVDESLFAAVDHALDHFGGVDLLIHCAGYFHMAEVARGPVEELDRLYRVNLRLPYLLTQRLLPSLCQRRGQIVLVNSTSGVAKVRGGASGYGATKHGLRAFADSLRDEVNAAGVRVLSIFPGRTASPMQQRVRAMEGLPYDPSRLLQPEDVAANILHALCLPPTAEVTELMVRPLLK